jgi:hypothetical protein
MSHAIDYAIVASAQQPPLSEMGNVRTVNSFPHGKNALLPTRFRTEGARVSHGSLSPTRLHTVRAIGTRKETAFNRTFYLTYSVRQGELHVDLRRRVLSIVYDRTFLCLKKKDCQCWNARSYVYRRLARTKSVLTPPLSVRSSRTFEQSNRIS